MRDWSLFGGDDVVELDKWGLFLFYEYKDERGWGYKWVIEFEGI